MGKSTVYTFPGFLLKSQGLDRNIEWQMEPSSLVHYELYIHNTWGHVPIIES